MTQPSPTPAAAVSVDQRHPYFLDDPVVDALVEVCLELGGELWATRSRVARLEGLLEVGGRPVAELLEEQGGAEEGRAAWTAERDQFVERLFGVLARRDHVPASEIV
ncbi:hypothetical protein [Egicoccus sp. AB-alg2]|uniref:hypothetical protein n=1 Tax=Egicoccus sp. AB-alg2 TaxID=3242693 RepID=UPI00359EB8B0